ncbi:hypothetical protein [Nodosilinea nodulosa]|uniref:hypothetical protein n=1 Tax=Nodosilinea nodulosa TaxID=416001 RepID=UPI0012D769DF|nr:hypothetical protein [Nodosilinea nodulosa]
MNDRIRALINAGNWYFAIVFERAVIGAVQLENGWIFCSVRYCADPKMFDLETGKMLVRDDIIDQIISYEAYKSGDVSAPKEAWYKLPVVEMKD